MSSICWCLPWSSTDFVAQTHALTLFFPGTNKSTQPTVFSFLRVAHRSLHTQPASISFVVQNTVIENKTQKSHSKHYMEWWFRLPVTPPGVGGNLLRGVDLVAPLRAWPDTAYTANDWLMSSSNASSTLSSSRRLTLFIGM